MIELILSVCLAAAPATCKDVRLSYMAETVTPHACNLYGQSEIARWLEAHPKWRPVRWGCRRAKLEAKA
ncbi:MAG: hypothetical protein KDJ37_08720 [Hyphomicrobiaceae bacterium]|nr:hypothetical protein [Hyphomicrobiaceae bacterium]